MYEYEDSPRYWDTFDYPKTKRDNDYCPPTITITNVGQDYQPSLSVGEGGWTEVYLTNRKPSAVCRELILSATEEKPASPKGEKPEVWERTQKTMEDIVSGEMGSMGRKVLRETLDKKEAPLTGKDAANEGLRRAIRFGG